MTEFELITIITESIYNARAFFDFWLTVTCTALAVGHYAFSDLSVKYQRYLISLYGLVSIIFLAHWFDAALMISSFVNDLLEIGAEPKETGFTGVIWLLQTGLMFAGTMITISYLRAKGKEKDD
jgi:hypothetical protein